MQFTISRKLLLGYLFMALLTLLVGTYAILQLQKLHGLAYEITHQHFIAAETVKSMMDALLAQESAEKKYFVFKDPSLEQIFWQHAGDFKAGLEKIRGINDRNYNRQSLDNLRLLHDRYGDYFRQEVALLGEKRAQDALNMSDTESRATIEAMAVQLKNMQRRADKAINDKMNNIAVQSSDARIMTLGIILLSLVLGITLSVMITRSIAKPLRQLQKATGLIAEGKLDHQIRIRRDDEIGSLASSFMYMTQRLKIFEEINLAASPLTGMPGNIAIENKIKENLAAHKMFALCQVDLDNFKPFADKYGYAWGSEVIKEVADILVDAKTEENIFTGHIGGDDFIIIADPRQINVICQKLIADFEKRIVRFYDDQDVQRGYIKARDRQGVIQKFPLITISAAIVTDDGTKYKNPLDMSMAVVELKEYAKMLPGSNYVTQEDWEKHNNLHAAAKQVKLEIESC